MKKYLLLLIILPFLFISKVNASNIDVYNLSESNVPNYNRHENGFYTFKSNNWETISSGQLLSKDIFINNFTLDSYTYDYFTFNLSVNLSNLTGDASNIENYHIQGNSFGVNVSYSYNSNNVFKNVTCDMSSTYSGVFVKCPIPYDKLYTQTFSNLHITITPPPILEVNRLFATYNISDFFNLVSSDEKDNTNKVIENNNDNTDKIIEDNKKNFETCSTDEKLISSFTIGSISSTGELLNNAPNRIRSSNISVSPNTEYTITHVSSDYLLYVFEYSSNGSFISRIPPSWTSFPYTFRTDANSSFIRFVIRKVDDTNFSNANIGVLSIVSEETCKNKIDETNENINELNDNITSDDVNNSDDTLSNLQNQIATNNVISDLLLLPITLYQKIINSLNGSCSSYNLGSLYGTNLVLPCINLQNYLGSNIFTAIDLIISGLFVLVIRKKFVDIFNNMTNLKNGGNEIE